MKANLDPINVMSVRAVGGTAGAKEAFELLETKLPSRRGRRFYGAYDHASGVYRACAMKVTGEDAGSRGLEEWVIPGGTYLSRKVNQWQSKIPDLPKIVGEMAAGQLVDESRPTIEFYRSAIELVIYLPVR